VTQWSGSARKRRVCQIPFRYGFSLEFEPPSNGVGAWPEARNWQDPQNERGRAAAFGMTVA